MSALVETSNECLTNVDKLMNRKEVELEVNLVLQVIV
jgi:hypothetical protein